MSEVDHALRNVAKGASFIFFGMFLEYVISFFAKVATARYLDISEFGSINLGITLLSIIVLFSTLGLSSGIIRYFPRFQDPGKIKGVIVSAFKITLPLSIFFSVSTLFLSDFIAAEIFHRAEAAPVLRIFAIIGPFSVLTGLGIAAMQGKYAALQTIYIQNLTLPVSRMVLLGMFVYLGLGELGVAYAYALPWLFSSIICIYYIHKLTPLFSRIRSESITRELFLFSIPLALSGMMILVIRNTDVLMIGYFRSLREVGMYSAAFPVADMFNSVLVAFNFLFMPAMSALHAKGSVNDMKRLYQVITKWSLMLILPFFIIVVLFPERVIDIIYGLRYIESAEVLRILVLGFFTTTLSGLAGSVLTAIGESRQVFFATASSAIINVFLNFLLIPRFGIVGAAAASFISIVVMNLYLLVHLYKVTGINPFTTSMLKPAAGAIIAFLSLYLLTVKFVSLNIYTLLAMLLVFLIIYTVTIPLLGGIEKEDGMIINSIEQKTGISLEPVKSIFRRLM